MPEVGIHPIIGPDKLDTNFRNDISKIKCAQINDADGLYNHLYIALVYSTFAEAGPTKNFLCGTAGPTNHSSDRSKLKQTATLRGRNLNGAKEHENTIAEKFANIIPRTILYLNSIFNRIAGSRRGSGMP